MKQARANITQARDAVAAEVGTLPTLNMNIQVNEKKLAYNDALTEIDAGLTRLREEIEDVPIREAKGVYGGTKQYRPRSTLAVKKEILALLPSPAKPTEKEPR